MAKAKRKKRSSTAAYFQEIYAANPEWVADSKNDQMYDKWKEDHNGQDMPSKARQSMANVKSKLRKEQGIPTGRGRGGRPKGSGRKSTASAATKARTTSGRVKVDSLEALIDNCLMAARRQEDQEGMESVIKHLHRARNNYILRFDKVS